MIDIIKRLMALNPALITIQLRNRDMERATELHWLKWFYQAADIGLTEEDRIELERQFVKEENLLIPKAYEVDDIELTKNVRQRIPLSEEEQKARRPLPVGILLSGLG